MIEKKQIGSETIDGHPCNKYESVFCIKDNPAKKYKAILWETEDLGGLVIRSETALPPDKALGEKIKKVNGLKENKIGAAKAPMFEVQRDYRELENMMEPMGGVPKIDEMFKCMKGGKNRPLLFLFCCRSILPLEAEGQFSFFLFFILLRSLCFPENSKSPLPLDGIAFFFITLSRPE